MKLMQVSLFRHWILWLIVVTCGLYSVVRAADNASPDTKQGIYVITDFGAQGDGKTLNTDILNRLVETCASAGGGKVIIPPGRFLTGPIFLKSNIHIEIVAGATLLADTDIRNYPAIDGRWEGIERKVYASLFTGHDLQNVSITGRGTIDGQGEVWWHAFLETVQMRKALGINEREPDNPEGAPLRWPRPRVINLYRCKNVLIRDVTILNSPSWTVHPVYCEDVTVDNVRIFQPSDSPNTDGVNPDSCKNVRISNCHIDVGDDCITIKSGYNEDGRRVGNPCENITITNCTMLNGHGGVVIGSEMSGDVRNVTISNCIFDGTQRGLRIKTTRDRGGIVEDIRADNLVMRNISEAAFSVTMFYADWHPITKVIPDTTDTDSYPITEKTPRIRNLYFNNISVVSSERVAEILGLAEMPIDNIQLRSIEAHSSRFGIQCGQTKNAVFEQLVVNTQEGPALVVHNALDLEIDQFTTRKPHPETPVILLEGVDGALIRDCKTPDGADPFLQLAGQENRGIEVSQPEFVIPIGREKSRSGSD